MFTVGVAVCGVGVSVGRASSVCVARISDRVAAMFTVGVAVCGGVFVTVGSGVKVAVAVGVSVFVTVGNGVKVTVAVGRAATGAIAWRY